MEKNIGYIKKFLISKSEIDTNGKEGLYSKILLNFKSKFPNAKVAKTHIVELGLAGDSYEYEIEVLYDEDISKLERSTREAEDYITKI